MKEVLLFGGMGAHEPTLSHAQFCCLRSDSDGNRFAEEGEHDGGLTQGKQEKYERRAVQGFLPFLKP